MAVQTVQATAGDWTFTMPDQVTLSQGGASTLALNGGTTPLVIDVRLNADLLFGGSGYHGIISIQMDDLPGGEATENIVSGLRGPIEIRFHNELGIPINNPPGDNNTMAVYVAGKSDIFAAPPPQPPDNAFHTLYTHFHNVEPADFPGLTLTKQVGPFVGAQPGNVEEAPNWLGLDGTIAAGTSQTWGPFTFHRRDTDAEDDASLNIIFFQGAFDPAALAALEADWKFRNDPPTLGVADATTLEGGANSGGTLNHTVSLSRAAPVPVTVQYATSDGTATANADYAPASGSVTFAPGEVSKTVSVNVNGDAADEPDETVTLTLSAPTAPVTLAKATATGTIGDDDDPAVPPPTGQFAGTDGPDVLRGTAGSDSISALAGDDLVVPLGGDDFVEGGAGVDTAAYSGVKRSYGYSGSANGRSAVNGPEGNDTLNNVERVSFTDGRYETDATGTAGKIYRIYDATLDRAPDAGGMRTWHDAASNGVPLQTIVNGFVGSSEFTGKYGNTDDEAFVRLLYRNVLGREGEDAGVRGWVDALRGGTGRPEVVLGFSESPENVRRSAPEIEKGLWVGDSDAAVVARTYDSTLGRRPDAGGLKAWKDALESGLTVNQMADGFTGSAEFQAKYGPLDDRGFVELLYRNVLGRDG